MTFFSMGRIVDDRNGHRQLLRSLLVALLCFLQKSPLITISVPQRSPGKPETTMGKGVFGNVLF